jgi:hypothetical protein
MPSSKPVSFFDTIKNSHYEKTLVIYNIYNSESTTGQERCKHLKGILAAAKKLFFKPAKFTKYPCNCSLCRVAY